MQVILQEKIKNLGAIGEIVDVKPGYARNYLFRSGKALPANEDNVAIVMAKRSELEKIEKEKFEVAKKRAKQIAEVKTVELTVPTNEEGKLFGSIGSTEIAEALLAAGVEVSKQELSIVESPVRTIGKYTIVVETHPDVIENLVLNLTSNTIEVAQEDEESPVVAEETSEEAESIEGADSDPA